MTSPQLLRRGKVRDIYAWGEEIWLVAFDRISAYDVPEKLRELMLKEGE